MSLSNMAWYGRQSETEEDLEQTSKTGTAEGVIESIFDTKLREYVISGIPEDSIDIEFYDGEPEPIIAAAQMLERYDELQLTSCGFIIGRKGNHQVVYDSYRGDQRPSVEVR